ACCVWANCGAAAKSKKVFWRGAGAGSFFDGDGRQPRHWVPVFFRGALQRVWSHALRGDRIVLVTGTLAPLAEVVKAALERELLWRGVESRLRVFATELGLRGGLWTGRIEGAPRFGEAKAA